VSLGLTAHPNAEEGPPIGLIEFYGLRSVSLQQVKAALNVKEGDPLNKVKSGAEYLEHRLAAIPQVAEARLNCVCCDEGRTVLFVGIREKSVPPLTFRVSPTNVLALPPEAIELNRHFEIALQEAVKRGDAKDDLSQGHSLISDPSARAFQEQFIAYASAHLETLRSVLRQSIDPRQRAVAAWIMGYAPDKRAVVSDLVEAAEDASEGVRNDAIRSLGAIAVLANAHPELRISIPAIRFIQMLNSVDWSDRNKSLMVLQTLTEHRPASVLKRLREQAMPALMEMARWKSHGFPAFVLVGRIGGVAEKEIYDAWNRNDREQIIGQWAGKAAY
jgi:hypothetical protein